MDVTENIHSHRYRYRAKAGLPFTICTVLAIMLSACGAKSGHFRIEGRFKNLNQGEFYIYNPDAATIDLDTIKVADGRFVYDVPLEDKTIFVIIFPNFSDQVVFGEPGATAKIKGDASHLREMEIKGTDDNKLMTDFRLNANKMTPPETIQSVEAFVNEHPKSPVSLYLINKYLVTGQHRDYTKAYKLSKIILQTNPDNGAAIRLSKQLDALRQCAIGSRLPDFKVKDIDGNTVSRTEVLNGKINIVTTWASWSYESHNILRTLKRLKKQYGKDIAMLNICLDGNKSDYKRNTERDSITWPTICDGKMWETPLLGKMGLATVPGNIVADSKGTVVARDLDGKQLEERIKSMMK